MQVRAIGCCAGRIEVNIWTQWDSEEGILPFGGRGFSIVSSRMRLDATANVAARDDLVLFTAWGLA